MSPYINVYVEHDGKRYRLPFLATERALGILRQTKHGEGRVGVDMHGRLGRTLLALGRKALNDKLAEGRLKGNLTT